MKTPVYRRLFIPSMVAALVTLSWSAAMAQGCQQGGSLGGPGDGMGPPPGPGGGFAPPGGGPQGGRGRPGPGGAGGSGMFARSGPGGGGGEDEDEGPGGGGFTPPGGGPGGGPGMFGHPPGGGGICPPHMGAGGHFPPPPPPPGMGGPMGLPLHDLDLTETQQEKLAEIESDTRDKADLMMVKMHSLERQYRAALMQPEINREQLAKYQSQLSQQKQALDAVFNNSMSVSAQLLTPAQRKSLRLRMTRDELGIGPGKGKNVSEHP